MSALIFRLLLALCMLCAGNAYSGLAPARWFTGDGMTEVTYGSFDAAKSSFIPSMERYNNHPAYVCSVTDWTWSFMGLDTFKNSAYWTASLNPGARCIHNHPAATNGWKIGAWCGEGAATQPDGSCQCPVDKPEEVNGRCFARCPEGQFRGTTSFQCKPRCPSGFYLSTSQACQPLPPCTDQSSCPPPDDADPEQGDPCTCSSTCVGNPVNAATGSKFQSEVDVVWGPGLEFTRFYNAGGQAAGGLPRGWRHNYSQQIRIVHNNSYHLPADVDPDWPAGLVVGTVVDHYEVVRPDGKTWRFSPGGQAVAKTPENNFSLSLVGDGFLLQDGVTRENYDALGRLTRVERIGSSVVDVRYDGSGNLMQLIDTRGFQLDLGYGAGMTLLSATGLGTGSSVGYYRDGQERLAYLRHADSSRRTYHYEEPSQPYALTGITDEENQRFASWRYDALGRVYESKHGSGNADKVTLTFSADATYRYTDVLDALGATRRHTFKSFNGRWLPAAQSQPAGAGCNAASSAMTYDPNGNIKTRTDFRGSVTEYLVNAQGLETSRTEARGRPEQRIITTEWHPTFRLPTRITEPGRVTEFLYNDKAHVTLKKVIDTSGATAVTRATTYTHVYNADVNNPYLKKLTVNGPRADGVALDEVIYDFDSRGLLATVTRKNSSGTALITRYDEYDGAGRARRITDADGRVTALFYNARGWLTRRIVGYGSSMPLDTAFVYYYSGLLKQVTLPDQSYVTYTYDDAHRLTEIKDMAGNSIKYTLDAAGNRLEEIVNDVSGTLAGLLQQVDTAQQSSRVPALGEL